jgi:hypothetical protein
MHACNNAVRENSEEQRGGLTSLFFPLKARIYSVSAESRLRHLIFLHCGCAAAGV